MNDNLMTYRVLGSPYALVFHQHVAYLRLKRLPFNVYCRRFTTTLFYALVFRARNSFCTVTPEGRSYLQMWQLIDAVERRGTQKGQNTILVNKRTHPNIHLATWIVFLYASWWLSKTGAMYRWIDSESVEVVEGYIRYFFLVPGIGFSRSIVGPFRQVMQKITAITGVSKETAPYMREHFQRFCGALDEHFQQHPDSTFLLGTPHPTLADVAMGAVFSAHFLIDDPPASFIIQKYPHLSRYMERVTGWRGGVFVDDDSLQEPGQLFDTPSENYADVIPETLYNFFHLVEEVMPFMLSQCAAFHAFMAGDGVRRLKKEPLEGVWEGCSGYLLPQITDIKSLMIIDNGIYTVRARAQDLEVALLAASEVMDDGDRSNVVNDDGDGVVANHDDSEFSGSVAVGREKGAVDVSSVSRTHSIGDDLTTQTVISSQTSLDDADFHRVFTTSAARGRGALQPRRASAQLGRITVNSCLQTLRDMLCQMHHPHYTLSSVFHGRKMFVAVVPECEVAKKRKMAKEHVH